VSWPASTLVSLLCPAAVVVSGGGCFINALDSRENIMGDEDAGPCGMWTRLHKHRSIHGAWWAIKVGSLAQASKQSF